MSDQCAECGAVLSEGSTCQAIFDEFLSFESTDVVYGQVHDLTVACFLIQHGRYNDSVLIWMQSKLQADLDAQPGYVPQQKPELDNSSRTRKLTSQADEQPLRKIAWSMTIADVARSSQDATMYCEKVKQWAQAILNQLNDLFQKSSLLGEDVLTRFLIKFDELITSSSLYQLFTNTKVYADLKGMSNVQHKRSILYMRMRQCIGIIGVALPLVLIFGLILWEGQLKLLDAVSQYYYSDYTPYSIIGPMFVSGMFATGIFLICYQYRLLDDIISSIAGICAIGVAFFPTTPPDCPPKQVCANPPAWIGNVHTLCAMSFLSLLAFMTLFLFPKSDKNLRDRTTEKLWRNGVYYICGSLMVVFLVLGAIEIIVSLVIKSSWLQPVHPLAWIEIFAVEIYGIAWFIKGETFGVLKDKATQLQVIIQNLATKLTATILGILAGAIGVIHGVLEFMQGNATPKSVYIYANAVGSPCQPNREWHSCFPSVTFIHGSFWVTGVFAIIVGLLIIIWTIWAIWFVKFKYGSWILIVLSFIQFFVGGGYISPILCFIAGVVGAKIDDPFPQWSANPDFLWQGLLARLWPWSWYVLAIVAFIAYAIHFQGFLITPNILIIFITILLLILAVLTTFAHDIQERTQPRQVPKVEGKPPFLEGAQ